MYRKKTRFVRLDPDRAQRHVVNVQVFDDSVQIDDLFVNFVSCSQRSAVFNLGIQKKPLRPEYSFCCKSFPKIFISKKMVKKTPRKI